MRRFPLAYHGPTDPAIAGIGFDASPPCSDEDAEPSRAGLWPTPGWHIVSIQLLPGVPATVFDQSEDRMRIGLGCHVYPLEAKPVAAIGHSIHVYHLTKQDAGEIRRSLRL